MRFASKKNDKTLLEIAQEMAMVNMERLRRAKVRV